MISLSINMIEIKYNSYPVVYFHRGPGFDSFPEHLLTQFENHEILYIDSLVNYLKTLGRKFIFLFSFNQCPHSNDHDNVEFRYFSMGGIFAEQYGVNGRKIYTF